MSQFNNRAVTELLKTFSKTEVKEFKKYVAYRGSKNAIAMWEILAKNHPHYDVMDKAIYKAVRPKQVYKDNVYRIWVTELTNLAKEFVATQAFHQNSLLFNNTLSMSLLQRRAKKMGQKVLSQQEKELKKIKEPNSHFYTYSFQHEDTSYQYVTVLAHRAFTDSLQTAANYLDYSYIVQKLKFLFAMHNRRRIVKEEYDLRMEPQLLAYLETHPVEDEPLIHLYYLMLCLMRDLDDHGRFFKFLTYFKAHRDQIDPIESRQLTSGAMNFCYWNIQSGHLTFLAPRMELVRIMVEEGFVLVDGLMTFYHFRNTVRVAIEANQIEWAATFIETWLPKVSKEQRPYLEAFNRAYLHFARGEYKRQAEWMLRMESADFSFMDAQNEIAFRILKLKTAFAQLGPTPKRLANEAFQAQLQAFRQFLLRKKTLPEEVYTSANNFQKALHQVHQKKLGKALKVGDLREYVLGLQSIRELPWLLGEMG